MRKIGAYVVIAALAAAVVAPSPKRGFRSAHRAVSSRPAFPGPFFSLRPPGRASPRRSHGLHRYRRTKRARGEAAQSLAPALLYPGLALPALYDGIFGP